MRKLRWTIISVALFLVAVVLWRLFAERKTPPVTPTPTITPTAVSVTPRIPTQTMPSDALTIIRSEPVDDETNVALDKNITIFFNRSVDPKDIVIATAPDIRYRLEYSSFTGNRITLRLIKPLAAGFLYTVKISYTPYPYYPQILSFTASGPTQPFLPDTQPIGIEEMEKQAMDDRPDLFLAGKVPYETSAFRVVSEYEHTPPVHFFFHVSLKGTDQNAAKQAFIQWLYALGMQDSHIDRLDLR